MDDPSVAAAVLHVIGHEDFEAKFKHPLKFNGTDFVQERLTTELQVTELSQQACGKLHVFLERYGTMLPPADVEALSRTPAASTQEAQIWLQRLRAAPPSASSLQKTARRRRWQWAKREMAKPSAYFDEEEMRGRDPRRWQQLVGRHVGGTSMMQPMKGGLSAHLLQQLDREVDQEAASATKKPRVGELEDEDDDGGAHVLENGSVDLPAARAEFLRVMRDRFVEGGEPGFDYSLVDDDEDLDDLEELGQDAEERYFDDM